MSMISTKFVVITFAAATSLGIFNVNLASAQERTRGKLTVDQITVNGKENLINEGGQANGGYRHHGGGSNQTSYEGGDHRRYGYDHGGRNQTGYDGGGPSRGSQTKVQPAPKTGVKTNIGGVARVVY